MRALRWDGVRLALALGLPDPEPAPGEALVRVHLGGISRADQRGDHPGLTPGGAFRPLAARRVSVAALIDAVYPLGDAVAAFTHAATPGTLDRGRPGTNGDRRLVAARRSPAQHA